MCGVRRRTSWSSLNKINPVDVRIPSQGTMSSPANRDSGTASTTSFGIPSTYRTFQSFGRKVLPTLLGAPHQAAPGRVEGNQPGPILRERHGRSRLSCIDGPTHRRAQPRFLACRVGIRPPRTSAHVGPSQLGESQAMEDPREVPRNASALYRFRLEGIRYEWSQCRCRVGATSWL